MIFNDKTKENIKDVVFSYDKKSIDEVFYDKVVELLNLDEAFCGNISHRFLEKSDEWAFVDMLSKKLYFVPEKLHLYVNDLVKNYVTEYSKEDFDKLKKLYYLFTIFHEATHVEQCLMMYNNFSDYEELNRMYLEIFTKLNTKGSLFAKMLYHFFAETFSYERNANINAYRELGYVYEGTILMPHVVSNYVTLLLSGYKETKSGIISPVEDTMKKIGIKYNINHGNIPFSEALEHGLPINVDRYNELYDFVAGVALGDVDFHGLRKIMK